MYEKARELHDISYQHWLTKEVFSYQWFIMLAVVLAVYIVWLALLDRKRTLHLLLLGSLAAVAYMINNMVVLGFNGAVSYNIRLLPMQPELFITSVTLSPINIMLAQQYTSTWKGYILWSGADFAFMCFVIFPVYTWIGILTWYGWNYFHHFIVLMVWSIFVKAFFNFLVEVQKRHDAPAAEALNKQGKE